MISVVIPNFNGVPLFKQFLARNLALFKAAGLSDIIISDDASTDDSVTYLQTHHPEITLIQNKQNRGFSHTINAGIAQAKEDIVLLLNTDMDFQNFDIQPILSTFKQNPNLFALTPPIYRKNNEGETINESFTTGWFEGGWFRTENTPEIAGTEKEKEGLPLLWACGGAMYASREKLNLLNGFDTLFSPFYVEDLDLSYRAWKQGWEVRYTQATPVDHQHQSTIGTYFTKAYVTKLHLRNQYIFMWKTLSDPLYIGSHFVTVAIKVLTLQIKDIKAISAALPYILTVIKRRSQLKRKKQTDSQILSRFSR